jgi:hypothetical protein
MVELNKESIRKPQAACKHKLSRSSPKAGSDDLMVKYNQIQVSCGLEAANVAVNSVSIYNRSSPNSSSFVLIKSLAVSWGVNALRESDQALYQLQQTSYTYRPVSRQRGVQIITTLIISTQRDQFHRSPKASQILALTIFRG